MRKKIKNDVENQEKNGVLERLNKRPPGVKEITSIGRNQKIRKDKIERNINQTVGQEIGDFKQWEMKRRILDTFSAMAKCSVSRLIHWPVANRIVLCFLFYVTLMLKSTRDLLGD